MKPKRVDSLTCCKINENLVIIEPSLGEVHELSEVAVSAWNLADGNKTISNIAKELVNNYDTDLNTLESDLNSLFEKFLEKKLIESN